jgi:hypothetical protein
MLNRDQNPLRGTPRHSGHAENRGRTPCAVLVNFDVTKPILDALLDAKKIVIVPGGSVRLA